MKKLKIFFVVFFAAIMLGIGTGVVTAQAYRIPEQNPLVIGVSMLTPTRSSAVINPLDSKTIAMIENGSLTLQAIAPIKEMCQDVVTEGFKQWQKQKIVSGELKPFSSPPDNETLKALFFQFLSESQKDAEIFKYYDELLSYENQKILEQQILMVNRIFENIDLILSKGTLVREWNTTTTQNGTELISICQSYQLEINGTTLSATKVTVISSDGTVIQDPYIMIRKTDLIHWSGYWQLVTYYVPVWTIFGLIWVPVTELWWIPVPILYGYDFACFLHLTTNEKTLWISDTVYRLDENVGYQVASMLVAAAISGFVAAAILVLYPEPVATKISAAVSALISFIAALIASPIDKIPKDLKTKILEVEQINDAIDPNFGFRFYEYVHAPVTPPIDCLDKQATHAWYYVTANNGIVCATPPFDKPLPVSIQYATTWVEFYHWVAINYGGYNNWIWIGGIPGGTPAA